ncbi:MAG: signal peptidase I [Brachymonas sp.]|nr:signal peptidase I [Brachymonas sp.]
MAYLTALVLGLFVAYMGGWFLGYVEGNMALLLSLATLVTGMYWLADKLIFLPRRRALVARYEQQLTAATAPATSGAASDAVQAQSAQAAQSVQAASDEQQQTIKKRLLAQPWWLDWTAGLFPVIALVFTLRSFAFEPFKIPSGSMLPTLEVGDLILVNKWKWGLRLPVVHTRLTQGSPVQRGDVMVFRYPPKPSVDYIKRVVGLPGDTVSYLNKQLVINGQEIEKMPMADYLGLQEKPGADGQTVAEPVQLEQYREQLGTHTHRLLNDPQRPAGIPIAESFPKQESCNYSPEGVTCKVPEGHYLVLGDNRDDSYDSRFWGFVPERNIVGKAEVVWLNLGNLRRIGRID